MIVKKAQIDLSKRCARQRSLAPPSFLCCRAGELTEDEIETLKTIIANPQSFNIPDWCAFTI